MPTYQYACTECGNDLEVVQKFTDEPLTECPVCHGRLRKVFSPVGVVFKGSGFYRTDSRQKEKEPAAASSANGSSDAKADGAGKGADKRADKAASGSGDGAKSATDGRPKSPQAHQPPELRTGRTAIRDVIHKSLD